MYCTSHNINLHVETSSCVCTGNLYTTCVFKHGLTAALHVTVYSWLKSPKFAVLQWPRGLHTTILMTSHTCTHTSTHKHTHTHLITHTHYTKHSVEPLPPHKITTTQCIYVAICTNRSCACSLWGAIWIKTVQAKSVPLYMGQSHL